jgi:hypothetical protein
MMDDPLDDARTKLLNVIERLERLTIGLQDVNAGVSLHVIEELHQLRSSVPDLDTGSKLEAAWDLVFKILKVVAPSLIKLWIETLSCFLTAIFARRRIYEGWRMPQIVTLSCRTIAARAGGKARYLGFDALTY